MLKNMRKSINDQDHICTSVNELKQHPIQFLGGNAAEGVVVGMGTTDM